MRYLPCLFILPITLLTSCSDVKEEASHLKQEASHLKHEAEQIIHLKEEASHLHLKGDFGPGPDG